MASEILNIGQPIECHIIQRLNRFVVEISLQGNHRRAYINNTGRLTEFLLPGRDGFCIKKEKEGKTDCRLFAIRAGNLGAIIDTQLQTQVFQKSLAMNRIPWLKGFQILKRNARLGDSLIDYLLECNGRQIYLEVKSAVLRQGSYAMYPDCPSARGRKHIRELTNYVSHGGKAVILFIAALPEVRVFKPNRSADPELYELLVKAHQAGVELKSIGMFYRPEDACLCLFNPDLNINLTT